MTQKRAIAFVLTFAAAVVFAGCKKEDEAQTYNDAPKNTDTHGQGHEHEHELGPHGGHVVELTDDESYHGEVTYDPATRTVTFYVLGDDIKTPVSVGLDAVLFHFENADGEEEIAMIAAPQEGDDEGKASSFTVSGDNVPAAVDDVEKIHGHVHVTINGKEYNGEIKHEHGDHADDGNGDDGDDDDGDDDDGDDDDGDDDDGDDDDGDDDDGDDDDGDDDDGDDDDGDDDDGDDDDGDDDDGDDDDGDDDDGDDDD